MVFGVGEDAACGIATVFRVGAGVIGGAIASGFGAGAFGGSILCDVSGSPPFATFGSSDDFDRDADGDDPPTGTSSIVGAAGSTSVGATGTMPMTTTPIRAAAASGIHHRHACVARAARARGGAATA